MESTNVPTDMQIRENVSPPVENADSLREWSIVATAAPTLH